MLRQPRHRGAAAATARARAALGIGPCSGAAWPAACLSTLRGALLAVGASRRRLVNASGFTNGKIAVS